MLIYRILPKVIKEMFNKQKQQQQKLDKWYFKHNLILILYDNVCDLTMLLFFSDKDVSDSHSFI